MAKTTQDLINERIESTVVPFRNRLISVSNIAVQQLMVQNPNRAAFTLINLGSTDVYILDQTTVSATLGIPVIASGGDAGLVWFEDYQLVTHEWFIMGTADSVPILLIEQIIEG